MRVFGQWHLAPPVPEDGSSARVCNDLNAAFNVVKAALADETLLITSEHAIPRGADLRACSASPSRSCCMRSACGTNGRSARRTGADGSRTRRPRGPKPGPGTAFGLSGNQSGELIHHG